MREFCTKASGKKSPLGPNSMLVCFQSNKIGLFYVHMPWDLKKSAKIHVKTFRNNVSLLCTAVYKLIKIRGLKSTAQEHHLSVLYNFELLFICLFLVELKFMFIQVFNSLSYVLVKQRFLNFESAAIFGLFHSHL